MRASHFRVVGRFTGGRLTAATVTVERGRDLIAVRPLRRRRTYELPLSAVAEFVVWHVTKAELRAKKAAKRGGRR